MKFLFLTSIILLLLIPACTKKITADLVLRGGGIVTVDEDFSFKESVAVKGDWIFSELNIRSEVKCAFVSG